MHQDGVVHREQKNKKEKRKNKKTKQKKNKKKTKKNKKRLIKLVGNPACDTLMLGSLLPY
jgi:hypothetical protein